MSEEDFAALLNEFDAGPQKRRQPRPTVGSLVSGKVISVGRDTVFVDLGNQVEGAIGREELTDKDGSLAIAEGDTLEARVAAIEDGSIVLRRSVGGSAQVSSAELEAAYAHGMPVDGVITGAIKGGVEVQVAGQRGFCPVSQLDTRYVENAEDYVGRRERFRITKYEGGRRINLVLSRRSILEEEAAGKAEALRKTLAEGQVVEGEITSLKPYGAFVDLGGLEGMIHISELGYERVQDPADIVSVGQKVKVAVLRIEATGDAKRPEKIALSLRSLDADPLDDFAKAHPAGSRISGKIERLAQFGAFVELGEGLSGLLHISELGAERRINHPSDVVKLGQEVTATILTIDRERRRIGLTLKEPEEDWRQAAGDADYGQGGASMGTLGDLLKGKFSG